MSAELRGLAGFAAMLCCIPLLAQKPVFLPVKKGGKWAYADTNGVVRTPFIYDFASEFAATGFASAGKNMSTVLLSSELEEMGFPESEFIFPLNRDMVWSVRGNESVLENTRTGEKIAEVNGLRYMNDSVFILIKNGLHYLYNRDMKPLNTFGYKEIKPWSYGLYMAGHNDAWALCGQNGRALCDTLYTLFRFYGGGLFSAINKSGKERLYHSTKGLVLEHEADYITVSPGFIVAGDQSRSYALIRETDSSLVIDAPNSIFTKSGTNCLVVQPPGEKAKLLDMYGRLLLPPRYDEIYPAVEGYYVKNNGFWGFCLPDNTELFPCVYEEFHEFGSGVITSVLRNGKLGIVNLQGETVVKPEFSEITFGPGNLLVRLRKGPALMIASFDEKGECTDITDYTNVITIQAGTIGGAVYRSGRVPVRQRTTAKTYGDSLWRAYGCWKDTPKGWMFFSHAGDTVISTPYMRIDTLNSRYTKVCRMSGDVSVQYGQRQVRPSDFYALVDEQSGRVILKPDYVHIRMFGKKILAYDKDMKIWVFNPAEQNSRKLGGPYAFIDLRDSTGKIRVAIKGNRKEQAKSCNFSHPEIGVWNLVSPLAESARQFGKPDHLSHLDVTLNDAEWQYLDANLDQIGAKDLRYRFIDKDVQGYHVFMDFSGKWGVLNDTGVAVLSGYDAVYIIPGEENNKPLFVVQNRKNSFHLLGPQNGSLFSDQKWRTLSDIGENMFKATTNKRKTIFFDAESGSSSPELDLVSSGLCSEDKILMRDRGGWFWADRSGESMLNLRFEQVKPFSGGLAAVYKDGRWGFADDKGALHIGLRYKTQIYSFVDGLAVVKRGGKTGLINKEGRFIFKCKYSDIKYFPQNGHVILNRNGGWQVWNSDGRQLDIETYSKVIQADSQYTVLQDDGLYTLVSRYGTRLTLEKGTELKSGFSEGFCVLKQKGLYSYMDSAGTVLPGKYLYAWPFSSGRAFAVTQSNRLTMLNTRGEKEPGFFELPYNESVSVSAFQDGIAIVNTDMGVRRFSRYGAQVDFPAMELAEAKRRGSFWIARAADKWAVLSRYGHIVEPFVFDECKKPGETDYTILESEFVSGIYDHKGNEILPAACTMLSFSHGSFFRAVIDNKLVWLNRAGRIIWDERTVVSE